MFEAFLVIALAIVVGLTTSGAIWLAVVMNKKFIMHYMRIIADVTKDITSEMLKPEVKEATENEIERWRWTENC